MKRAKTKKHIKPPGKGADDFISVARRLGCDEDKGQFEAKLGELARAKPKPVTKERK
jgi:hypothetical protein